MLLRNVLQVLQNISEILFHNNNTNYKYKAYIL